MNNINQTQQNSGAMLKQIVVSETNRKLCKYSQKSITVNNRHNNAKIYWMKWKKLVKTRFYNLKLKTLWTFLPRKQGRQKTHLLQYKMFVVVTTQFR